MQIKAKFRCNYYTDTVYQGSKIRRFIFTAVYGNSEENKTFSKATPFGTLDITVDEGTAAYDLWQPGKEYYLTFDAVPEPAKEA